MPSVKISELPAGAALSGNEVVASVQSGVTVKSSIDQIADYIGSTTTKAYAEMYFNDNTTATVIAAPGTAVKVEGTYNVDAGAISDFTHVNGVLTYTGTDTKLMKVICPLSLTFNLATDNISASIFKNGVEIPNSKSSQDTFLGVTSPAFHNTVLSTTTEMATNDTIEVRISTTNITSDVFAKRLNFIIEDFSAGASSSTQKVKLFGMTRTGIQSIPPNNTYVNLISTLGGTETFDADTLKVGDILEYRADGAIFSGNTGNIIDIELRFNGVAIGTAQIESYLTIPNDYRPFHITYRISIGDEISLSLLDAVPASNGYFGDNISNFTPLLFPGLLNDNYFFIDKTITNAMQIFYRTSLGSEFSLSMNNISLIKYSL